MSNNIVIKCLNNNPICYIYCNYFIHPKIYFIFHLTEKTHVFTEVNLLQYNPELKRSKIRLESSYNA